MADFWINHISIESTCPRVAAIEVVSGDITFVSLVVPAAMQPPPTHKGELQPTTTHLEMSLIAPLPLERLEVVSDETIDWHFNSDNGLLSINIRDRDPVQ